MEQNRRCRQAVLREDSRYYTGSPFRMISHAGFPAGGGECAYGSKQSASRRSRNNSFGDPKTGDPKTSDPENELECTPKVRH